MNENWPEIVETLLPYFGVNSAEGDYQREIEICLKFLGWKKTNETMRSQLTLPIGNNSSIRPDIVLWKKYVDWLALMQWKINGLNIRSFHLFSLPLIKNKSNG